MIDLLKQHYNDCAREKDLLPYLAIIHVRDTLIPPSERYLHTHKHCICHILTVTVFLPLQDPLFDSNKSVLYSVIFIATDNIDIITTNDVVKCVQHINIIIIIIISYLPVNCILFCKFFKIPKYMEKPTISMNCSVGIVLVFFAINLYFPA